MIKTAALPDIIVEPHVRAALREDLGLGGDITTMATIDPDTYGSVQLKSRMAGVICGVDIARLAFALTDKTILFTPFKKDGEEVQAGDVIADITGPMAGILTAERTALNYIGRLSGIASLTADMVALTAPYRPLVACTRKTTPGLRLFEKYAVRCGGGAPHRLRLDDCIMIKDNHIAANGGNLRQTLERARAYGGHTVRIEIEVDTLEQFKEVLDIGIADIVLLDNMDCAGLRRAVHLNKGKFILEASGNVTVETIGEIAATGIDVISIGALTHSAVNFDVGLDYTAGVGQGRPAENIKAGVGAEADIGRPVEKSGSFRRKPESILQPAS